MIIGGLAVAVATVAWAQRIVESDPFAAYKTTSSLGSIGVQLNDVNLKHYELGKLVASAHADRMDIREDRQFLTMVGIKDGVLTTDENERFHFTSPLGNYDAFNEVFTFSDGTHIAGKDMNLLTPSMTYEHKTGMLKAPGKIEGDLFGGTAMGMNLVMNLNTKESMMGPVRWQGMPSKIPGSLQDPVVGDKPDTMWDIESEKVTSKGKTDYFTNARASDGEILVKGAKLERDQKTDVITITGKAYYFSAKSNLVADKVVVYRKEKRAVLSGNVIMLIKPEGAEKLEMTEIAPFRPIVPDEVAANRPPAPSSAEADQQKDLDDEVRSAASRRKYPVVVRSDRVEYWYGEGNKHAVATGSPQARQELSEGRWRQIWTQEARYDGEGEKLKLVSSTGKADTRMKNSLGDDFKARSVEISTKEGDEDYEAEGVTGVFRPSKEDTDGLKSDGAKPATPPPATEEPKKEPVDPKPQKSDPENPPPPNTTGGGGSR